MTRRAGAALLALLSWAGPASAQTLRPFCAYKQLHGERRLDARIEFAAGDLRVLPGDSGQLYRMNLSYDADRFAPLSRYDRMSGATVLGVEPVGGAGLRIVSETQLRQAAVVAFSPEADLDLDLALGAVNADLELGALRMRDLRLKTGASRTTVRFSSPNPARCRSALISAGAAEVSVFGLGNSGCDELRLEGGIGKMILSFDGEWLNTQRAELSLAVGELVLRLPRGVPVRIKLERLLAHFAPERFIRRGSTYVTPGFDAREPHLDIVLRTAVGSVDVEWTD